VAEEAAVYLGIVELVKCTHEYCGVCGAPWLDDGDVGQSATGVCQVDQSNAVKGAEAGG